MKIITRFTTLLCVLFSITLSGTALAKHTDNFNYGWLFHLGDEQSGHTAEYNDSKWSSVRVPHDWSVALPYSQENTASSSGFKPGGIGWYRKHFTLSKADQDKVIWLEFDGIYNNAKIWVNGHFVTERPNGYISFAADVSPHMVEGNNVVAVRVDRTAYVDSRWYTGSGIYRDVRLVKAEPTHIPQWGVQITTPEVSAKNSSVKVNTKVTRDWPAGQKLFVDVELFDPSGKSVAKTTGKLGKRQTDIDSELSIANPQRWDLQSPSLYTAKVTLRHKRTVLDEETRRFGIRSIEFHPSKGFLLNNQSVKIKGVNLHHDAGAIGVAVPRAVWEYRLQKLQSIGVNAIRLSHNPHSTDLLELCDEMGLVVMAETFDDWEIPKDKSLVFLSDNAAKGDMSKSYSEHFNQWGERDLRDLILRDFNHPSIIMWSIGNEIEWTYPYYNQSVTFHNEGETYHSAAPIYEKEAVLKSFNKHKPEVDYLPIIAKRLSKYVKEMDTTRPVTAGLVLPSVAFHTGYTDALDVVGFNYRMKSYDAAHAMFPDKPLIGSENWGMWDEWKAVADRDFVPGIFVWTGFAYKGEAGPWPRKGLEISFFDYAGIKTARGHQFESFWVEKPKVYMATIKQEKSEFQFDKEKGWEFTERTYPIAKMQWLRPWEWYQVEETWNYSKGQKTIVHVYSNTEHTELFLNGKSLGKQALSDENNRVLLWQVPFKAGELRAVGYNNGKAVEEYAIHTHGKTQQVDLSPSKTELSADDSDVVYVHVTLRDKDGHRVHEGTEKVTFTIDGPARLLAVDNGWENSVQDETADHIISHAGRAVAVIQTTDTAGTINVSASTENGIKATVSLISK